VPQTLSLSMIVRNEERHLARCLEHAALFADEIVIVDTGSTDRTKEIAAQFTERVHDFTWCDDFAKARNYALQQCTGDFVMYLDADDVVTEEDARAIRALMAGPIDWDICKIGYHLVHDGSGAITKGSRIWRNFVGIRWKYPIHEVLQATRRGLRTKWDVEHIKVIHWPLQLAEHRPQKKDRNFGILHKALAVPEFAESVHLWWHLAKEYRRNGEPEEAIRALDRALGHDTERGTFLRSRMHLAKADLEHRLGRVDDALGTLGRSIGEYPLWREPFALLAKLQLERGQAAAALLVLQLAGQIPRHRFDVQKASYYGPEWSVLVSQALEAANQLPAALDEVRQALRHAPASTALLDREQELLARAAPGEHPPQLLGLESASLQAHPGDVVTVRFSVTARAAGRFGLGLSLRHAGAEAMLSDPANDAVVSVPAGTSQVTRRFQLPPDAAAGSYALLGALRSAAGDRLGKPLARLTKPGALTVAAR
jgi:tetratricopeptide (TPR) repeat protein